MCNPYPWSLTCIRVTKGWNPRSPKIPRGPISHRFQGFRVPPTQATSLLSLTNLSQALQAGKLRGWEQAPGLLISKLILNVTSSAALRWSFTRLQLVGSWSSTQWPTFLAVALFKGFSIGWLLPLLNYDYFFNLKEAGGVGMWWCQVTQGDKDLVLDRWPEGWPGSGTNANYLQHRKRRGRYFL